MRLPLIAAVLLVSAQFAPMSEAFARRNVPEVTAAARSTEAEAVSERDLLFAHHRMLGTEPDFRAMAEMEVDARPPPARAVRDPERERRYLITLAERRLRASFAAFDLDRRYRIRATADILGHDEASGGIPLRASFLRGVSRRDMTNRERGFTLRFRNPDAVRVVPTADERTAARMLQAAGLASLGGWSGQGVLTVEFVFAGALPDIAGLSDAPILGEIVGARLDSEEGTTLHRFANLGSQASAAVARRAGFPALREAELAGLHIGMPVAAARIAALRDHTQPLTSGFFESLAAPDRRGAEQPRCSSGLVADMRAFSVPLPPASAYAACLTFSSGEEDGPLAGRVAELVRLRFRPDTTPEAVREELEERFGASEDLPNGQLLWLGRDPTPGRAPGLLELRAEMARLERGGPEGEPGTLVAMTLRSVPPPAEEGG